MSSCVSTPSAETGSTTVDSTGSVGSSVASTPAIDATWASSSGRGIWTEHRAPVASLRQFRPSSPPLQTEPLPIGLVDLDV